ncbi:MAG: DUF4230 domain-containing protein [Elainellaceae cyanobacterium]
MEKRPSNRLGQRLFMMAQGGCILLLLFALAGIWRAGSSFSGRLMSLFALDTRSPAVDTRALVVSQVQGASELTTAIYTMEAVVPTSRDRVVGSFVVGRTTLLYIAHGEVRAGVDLSAIDASSVVLKDESLTVQLPPPKILDHKIDVSLSKVYDYDRGFLSLGPDAAAELQTLAQQETLNRIVSAACENNVLQQANQRAVTVVTQLLTTAGYDAVVVETQPPDTRTCTVETGPELLPVQPSLAEPSLPQPSLVQPPLDSEPPPMPMPAP